MRIPQLAVQGLYRFGSDDEHANALLHFHHAFIDEDLNRFADAGPANTEMLHELRLGGELVSGLVLAADLLFHAAGHFVGEGLSF